ncbi:MAG: hypothetical protein H0U23_18165 [Blastocatellia bacterium]|nr:hypothetical protein [Blastocatellia bacterium]
MKGIIVADGGSHSLTAENVGGGQWSRDQIVEAFLREHPAIDFVTTTAFQARGAWSKIEYGFRNKIYWRRPFDEALIRKLYPLVNDALTQLPPPVDSPQNAWRNVRSRNHICRGRRLGAYSWTPGQRLAISSRTFTGLMAGTLTDRDFRILFDQTIPPNGGPIVHFFRHLWLSGIPITSVRVDQLPDEDDDLITFTSLIAAERQAASNANACEIPTSSIIQYIAGLDFDMRERRPNHSTLASISPGDQAVLRRMQNEGRMLVAAELTEGGAMLRLSFGDPDGAVSEYT